MDGRSTSLPRCADDAEVADERLERLPISVLQHLIVQIRPNAPHAAPNKIRTERVGRASIDTRRRIDMRLCGVLAMKQSDLQ
jgi:hypothetical protein